MQHRKLNRREAIEFTGLDGKVFNNYFKNAREFSPLPRPNNRGWYYFRQDELARWKEAYENRIFRLTRDDYAECLDFSLAMHFRSYVTSDWGTGRQREFGQKVSNWVRGQLGEIGFRYFCREKLGFEVELDFDMHDEIVPQDIIAITRNGRSETPRNNIGIKASKIKSSYLVLSANEVERDERRSDVYVFTRVDLPDDHLLRIAPKEIRNLVRNQRHFELYQADIPDFTPIHVEVAGFSYIDDLEVVTSIPGQDFGSERYVKRTGDLRRSLDEWQEAIR